MLGFGDAAVAAMEAVFRDVCAIEADDGLEFARDSVRGEEIRSAADYHGVRLRLDARLARARIRVQGVVG